jgi:hypothetical protein
MTNSRRAPRYCRALSVATLAALGGGFATSGVADQDVAADVSNTATPIKHVVVVIGRIEALITSTPPMFLRLAKPC